MIRLLFLLPVLIFMSCPDALPQERKEGGLYPQPNFHKTGHFQVSDGHKLFYATCGNRSARPVMCLHGGPGAGSYPRLAQYFNPDKFFIVLHDQRGAGQSKPHGRLEGNTTQNLVEDMEKLRKTLNLGKVILFGGSWGTALALAYAETYPENVGGMILRGVFLGTRAEVEYHYLGNRFFYPKEYDALLSELPDPGKGAHPDYLYELVTGDDEVLRHKVLDALGRYELKFMKLNMPDEVVSGYLEGMPKDEHLRYARLDLHYVTNRYFLEEGQILRDIGKLRDIPVTLINGRYDMAAPPRSAYQVHKALPGSKLIIVEEAGHSESEEGITAALVKAAAEFE
jgi:proline iminopeptidase